MNCAKSLYIDKTFTTNLCGDVIVIEYKNHNSILVQYVNTGYEQWVEGRNLKTGKIADPYAPLAVGIGWIGEGKYSTATHRKEYSHWFDMLRRCSDKYRMKFVSYQGVSVCKDWLCFQSFAEWCQTQKGFLIESCELDKDILVPHNREYHPDKCCFVPRRLNSLFKPNLSRGYKNKTCATWAFKVKLYDGSVGKASFRTQEEGQAWAIEQKKEAIAKVAEDYKEQIDEKTYAAIILQLAQ